MTTRKVYLQQMSREEALEIFLDKLSECGFFKLSTEYIPAEECLGRVTSRAVFGKISSPHFRAAAMDGIAVSSSDTFGATETNPVQLELGTQAVEVDTGDPLPPEKDAVIKIEDVHVFNNTAEITAAAVPWQNVRPVGEDIAATEMLLPANHKIRPYDIGALLAGGINEVEVYKLPRVALLPTGTELVDPGEDLKEGSIIEYNSRVLAAMVKEWGGLPLRLQKTEDDYGKLKKKIKETIEQCEVLVVNAGSSAGREDYTAPIIEELGEVLVHGVAIKPGKPVVLGIVQNKPVVGIPGFPVSAVLSFELFVRPLVYRLQCQPEPNRAKIKCKLARRIYSSLGSDEYVRVNVGKVGGKYLASPLARGAGQIMSLVKAQGILIVPRMSEGFEAGDEVDVDLLESVERINNLLLLTGSHDLSLDLINDYMHRYFPGHSVISSHVGSLGGLLALKKGEAHAAGIHLLDPETGEYNVSYVKKHLPHKRARLVNLVHREQGIMVKKGNPLKIKGLEDLTREDVTFINRQRGAGTRVLLDYLLQKKGINPSAIKGYSREEYTHIAVGIAVSSGSANAGMGIKNVAEALDLDFIPVGKEKYDLCIPEEIFEGELIQKMLKIVNDSNFKNSLQKLGYDTGSTGEVMVCD